MQLLHVAKYIAQAGNVYYVTVDRQGVHSRCSTNLCPVYGALEIRFPRGDFRSTKRRGTIGPPERARALCVFDKNCGFYLCLHNQPRLVTTPGLFLAKLNGAWRVTNRLEEQYGLAAPTTRSAAHKAP